MIVERSIRSALMSVNNHGSIQIVEGELVAESKAETTNYKKETMTSELRKNY